MSQNFAIGTTNVKNVTGNTFGFAPFRVAKEIDLTQMTKKRKKILVRIISQSIKKVFCCKLHILKFQTLILKWSRNLCVI